MMEILRKTTEGRWTVYDILSSGRQYRIIVDEDGMWNCSCRSAKFRGICRHVLAIKMNREWMSMYPTIMANRVAPTPVSEALLFRLLKYPRYIAHMQYDIRATLAFGREMFLNGSKIESFCRNHEKIAGTVLDVVKNRGDDTWKVWDCYFYKGEDFRGIPLSKRLSRVELAVRALRSPRVEEAPLETMAVMKRGIYRWSGGRIILKDLGGLINTRPRNWLIAK